MKLDWKPHPKQLEFLNDPRPKVFYSGGLSTRGYYTSLMRRFFMKIEEVEELRCPHCTNDNPQMFTFSNRLRDRVNVHCESCAKDFIQKFNVPKEKMELPIEKEPKS